MPTFYIKNEQKNQENIIITGNDAKHIKGSLRHKVGDVLDVCDDAGIKYEAKIMQMEEEKILLQIMAEKKSNTESPMEITLLQGLPKADKMDFIVQKATELGVSEIIPVEMERSIVKLEEKNATKKVERWNKIAYEASKQSGRQKVPKVLNVVNLKNIIEKFSKYDIVILPYEKETKQNLKQLLQKHQNLTKVAVIIGPEGGFSENDLSLLNLPNIEKVTLGARILRTETAGIATLAMLMYENEFER